MKKLKESSSFIEPHELTNMEEHCFLNFSPLNKNDCNHIPEGGCRYILWVLPQLAAPLHWPCVNGIISLFPRLGQMRSSDSSFQGNENYWSYSAVGSYFVLSSTKGFPSHMHGSTLACVCFPHTWPPPLSSFVPFDMSLLI